MPTLSRTALALSAVLLFLSPALAGTAVQAVQSEVLETEAGELILTQEVVIKAPLDRVWWAYTTGDGWMAWAAPVAEVDLRAGGTVLTHYGPGAAIGDEGTNTLHIVNYVPEKVLTLRAELSDRWPEVMKEDAGNLMNVIVFEDLGQEGTRVMSHGVGYRNLPAYHDLMEFFIPANEGLLQKLKMMLEE